MPTIYLASHLTGKYYIFYYGMWCAIHRTHLLHRTGTPLPYFLGKLSIEKKEKGGTLQMLREMFESGQINKLLMFGSKRDNNKQHFGDGIFHLAKELHCEVRYVSLAPNLPVRFTISDPLLPVTQSQFVSVMNDSTGRQVEYIKSEKDENVNVYQKDKKMYAELDVLVIVLGVISAILVFLLLVGLLRLIIRKLLK